MEDAEGASQHRLFRKMLLWTQVLSQLQDGLLAHAGAGYDGAWAGAGAGDVGAHEEEGDMADLPCGPALEREEDGRKQMRTGHSRG